MLLAKGRNPLGELVGKYKLVGNPGCQLVGNPKKLRTRLTTRVSN